jgi:hypothetical protein
MGSLCFLHAYSRVRGVALFQYETTSFLMGLKATPEEHEMTSFLMNGTT